MFKRFPFVIFILLTYLFSWWTVPVANGALFPYGPTLAALAVLAFGEGRAGLREWWARLKRWRAGWWYLVGPLIIAAASLGAFGLYQIFGTAGTAFPKLPASAIWLELLLLGGLWEEPGWTGYALPKLQQRFAQHKNGQISATLVLALIRAVWHLPLLVIGTLPWFDVFVYTLFFQIIISWLYNRSRSVPVVMLFHYASNLLAGGMMIRAFAGSEKILYWFLFTICAAVIGLVILWREGSSLGSSSRRVNEASSPAISGEK